MKLTWLKSLGLLSTLTFVACDIEAAIDDLEQEAIQAAFDEIKGNAEKNGGTAEMVFPNKETVLEVKDANSPLFGAKVVVPAGALPAGIERAAATIQTPGAEIGVETDAQKFVGPVAAVALIGLPGLETVVPVKNLNISLPYAKTETTPVEQVGLGAVGATGVASVPDSTADEKFATGATTALEAAFVAIWNFDWDGATAAPANSFVYKVTNADGSTACVGLADFTEAYQGSVSFDNTTGAFALTIGTQGVLSINATSVSATKPDFGAIPQNAGGTTFTCSLSGTTFQASAVDAGSTMSITAFDVNTGTATIVGGISFTTAEGVTVKAAVNGTTPMTWVE